jgi:hypothetical protein
MSMKNFLEKENIRLLWDVLIDESLIKQLCNTELKLNNLLQIFESNINDFYLKEVDNCKSLIELNKKYILLMINYVIKVTAPNNNSTTNINNIPQQNQYKKIKIHPEEPIKQSITYEDIHNDRITLFEKELTKKQEEFTNAMKLPVPPTPNFSDRIDEPISELELEIKRIKDLRNYDIEVINNTNKNSSSSLDENWLKPQDTSIKNEKININKHIYWEDEQIIQEKEIYQEDDSDIFKKLKVVTVDNDTNDKNENKNQIYHYQLQIDEIKKDMSEMNDKLDLILEKLKN